MAEPVSDNDQTLPRNWEDYTDLPVGEILRRTRMHYNLSLDDVEDSLRIRAIQIGAIEEGRLDLLPGRAYAIGFVRAYAEFLGLDGGKMVHLFKAQSVGSRNRPELHFPATASESKVPNMYVLGGSLAVFVALLAALIIFNGSRETTVEIPPVPEPEQIEASSLDITAPPLGAALVDAMENVAGPEGAQAFIKPQSRIVITATDSAWVEVRNGKGKTLISRILKAGDSYLVPDEAGLKMDTGNAGALTLSVDGGSAFPLGEKGDVRRGVALDPDALAKLAPPPSAAAEEVPGTP